MFDVDVMCNYQLSTFRRDFFFLLRDRETEKSVLGKWGPHDRSGPHLADLASPFSTFWIRHCPRGMVWMDVVNYYDLRILNDGQPTRLDEATGAESHIDLTLVSSDRYCSPVRLDNCYGRAQ